MKAPALTELSDALSAAAPTLDADGRTIAKTIYQLLAHGAPITDTDIADETGLSVEQVVSTVDSWDGVFRDDERRIIGFWGLTVTEMPPHHLQVGGAELYAWCAWDTLFLPAILDATAHVQSTDPNNGETITLTVTPDRITERSHDQIVVSFLMPEDDFSDDVVESFCHYVHFFTDAPSAKQWTDTHQNTFAVPLDEAFDVGQRWNAVRRI